MNHRLQVAWSPQYSALEGHDYQQQVIDTVVAEKVLGVVELANKGVLNHASATRIAKLGWRIGEAVVGRGCLVGCVLSEPELPLSHSPTSRMRALVAACTHEAEFGLSSADARAWAHGVPAFVEVFDGEGELSVAIVVVKWPVCLGIDRCRATYGVHWHLNRKADRRRLCDLLFNVIQPGGCTARCPATIGHLAGNILRRRKQLDWRAS